MTPVIERISQLKLPKKNNFAYFSLVGVLPLLWLAAYTYSDPLSDWIVYFRPATIALLSGNTPYELNFFSPPWILIPLVPLALLPEKHGFATLFVVSFMVISFVAYRMGAKPLSLLALMLSFPVIHSLALGQIDWLVMVGLILPPKIGLFFIMAKPQFGVVIAIYCLFEAWQAGRIKEVVIRFAPVSFAFFLSFLIYGFWPMKALSVVDSPWNASLFPRSIPIGLFLLTLAFRRRNFNFAIASSPFLSPYVGPHSWSFALIGLVDMPVEVAAASIGTWIVRAFSNNF